MYSHTLIYVKQLYKKEQVLEAQYKLLSSTKMKDFQIDIFKTLHKTEAVPKELQEEKEQILAQLRDYEKQCEPILVVLQDEQKVKELKEKAEFTVEHFGVEQVQQLIQFAKFQYEIANYNAAEGYLFDLIELISKSSNPLKNQLPSLALGKLACEIVLRHWDTANDDLSFVREVCLGYSSNEDNDSHAMRAWVAHWSLFLWAFGKGNLDWWLNDSRIMGVVSSQCSYLLRYLIVALILKRERRKTFNKDIRNIAHIYQTSSTVPRNDPVIRFAYLLNQAQFLDAGEELAKMEPVLQNDFFTNGLVQETMTAARSLLFEQYAKIHLRIDLGSQFPLRKYLFVKNETEEDENNWILTVLKHKNAKLDSQNKYLILPESTPSIYQAIVEQTEAVSARTNQVTKNLQSLEKKTTTASTTATPPSATTSQ
jgi:hypothetical protein